MNSLAARLTAAADALEDDLPEGVAVIANLDGSPSLDEIDRYCAGLMLEAAEALARSPTPADGGRDRREEVARIIDPEGWASWETVRRSWYVSDSLAKADAILALAAGDPSSDVRAGLEPFAKAWAFLNDLPAGQSVLLTPRGYVAERAEFCPADFRRAAAIYELLALFPASPGGEQVNSSSSSSLPAHVAEEATATAAPNSAGGEG